MSYKGRIVGAVVQARNGSSRFPRKVFADLAGRPVLGHIIDRLRAAKTLDVIVIATTREPRDAEIADYAISQGVRALRGDTNDVQSRFVDAAREHNLSVIVRICGDSPFIDPEMIDRLVREMADAGGDYAEPDPATPAAYEGMEAMTADALLRSRTLGDDGPDREHVTHYMRYRSAEFRIIHPVPAEATRGHFRLSVDNYADLEFARAVYASLYSPGKIFTAADLAAFLRGHPEAAALNAHVVQKKTDAKDFHVAFYIARPEQIDAALPRARLLNEAHHCGIGFVGHFSSDDENRIRAMGYRTAIIGSGDEAAQIRKLALDWRLAAILTPPDENYLPDLSSLNLKIAAFDEPPDMLLKTL